MKPAEQMTLQEIKNILAMSVTYEIQPDLCRELIIRVDVLKFAMQNILLHYSRIEIDEEVKKMKAERPAPREKKEKPAPFKFVFPEE